LFVISFRSLLLCDPARVVFFKEKRVKKKAIRGVIVRTRENYKSRRVAAAQRRTLCVRTGLQSRPPRPFLPLFLEITVVIISIGNHKGSGLLLVRRGFWSATKMPWGGGKDRSGILRRRYSGEPGPKAPPWILCVYKRL